MKYRALLCVFSLLCFLCPSLLQGADATVDPAALKAILGSETTNWTITSSAHALTPGKGVTTPGWMYIDGNTPVKLPAEYLATFRLHPSAGSSSFSLTVGQAELPDKSKQAFTCSASAAKAGEAINYSMSATPETGKAVNGALSLRAVNERSLGWSEEMRKTIEAQIAAAPKIDELTCTLRLALTANAYRAWLNGRYIGELPVKADAAPAGTVRLSLNTNAELLSFRANPVMVLDNRFEPLDLGGFVNAAALVNGQRVAKLPATGRANLDGITFRFPASTNGNDHLDLGPSWTRFGAISGYIAANFGTFGGRWISADRIDPSRFCMYVPYGPYKALHLIAAFDGEKDNVPVVTAQFYRPDAGHPMNFAGKVPAFNTKSGGVKTFPVTLANGNKANLYHVIIPIDPGKMAWFGDLDRVGLELTKAVQPYRAYPDPLEYSWHAAGLPSGVHIYAATLEKAKVGVDPQPDAPAHVWTAPALPSYTIKLTNNTGAAVTAKLTVVTVSYDGKDKTTQQQTAAIPVNGSVPVTVTLKPTRYGLQTLKVTCVVADETTTQQRNFAYLHPETREKGGWARGKGPIFGYWNWSGGHDTPPLEVELSVMGQAGCETSLATFLNAKPEITEMAKKWQYTAHAAFPHGVIYLNSFSYSEAVNYDPKNPEKTQQYLIDKLTPQKLEPGPLNVPEYIPFFPEPGLGPITYGIWPTWYNEKDYQWTEKEKAYFDSRLELFLLGAKAVRKQWPDVKILLPYGDPHYTALFLRHSEEARKYIDGTALDMPNFERLPEQQVNQVVLNRLYPIMQDIKQYIKDPYLVLVEGTCTSSKDYDTTPEDQANVCTRNLLVLTGYGVNIFDSGADAPFDCANYWGENHYGGGYCSRLPLAMPKLAYISYATLTRHVNRKNFVKYVPTGSTSVYCQQYTHYKTDDPTYVLWTIRGKRPVSVAVQPGQTVQVYDVNDNPITLTEQNGKVTFTIAQAPVYLEGLKGEAVITLGESDHTDALPAKTAKQLTNLGSGWTLAATHDEEYENTNKLQIERFLGNFTAQTVTAPKAQGGKALAVHLGKQDIDRKLMPYYTTFQPAAPITIPGKASHLGLWVKASSDWGRVVYSLRDAKGEKWINVGTKDDWNGDDMRCWSAFAFDGWRYLRFEVPSSAPYDSYRELGTSFWGSYEGDGIVDLPLRLEKIIVERRPAVIYGNALVPAKADDVLLGDLYAEYASTADGTAEAIRLSQLRMPTPAGVPTIDNPITELAKTGIGASTQVLKVQDPEHMYDGTRCHVFFTPVDGAKDYDVWVAPYEDGRGAIQLGTAIQPGDLIQGLRPELDFYVFVTYTDKDGKVSKPSAPLKIRLKNRFVYQ